MRKNKPIFTTVPNEGTGPGGWNVSSAACWEMGLNIKMLMKEAIITSKVIFLPFNFNGETDWE